MNTRRMVRPSPRTVTEFSRGQHSKIVRPRRSAAKNSGVVVLKVDPRVWKTALDLADGDRQRIEVVNENEVVVHNHPKKKRA